MGQAARIYASHYTVAEWERWQDQWELIEGVPYCMSPAPSNRHQEINGLLYAEILRLMKTKPCAKCKVFIPIDWQISEDTVVQPDVLVICEPIKGIRLTFPPEAIFEILSPSTRKKDKTEKFELYQSQKVKYYTLVDPETEEVEIFTLGPEGFYQKVDFNSTYSFEFGECKVEIDFKSIWE